MDKTGTGFLRVRTSSANNAIPVEGALVVVYEDSEDGESGKTLRSMRTDSSGITDTVSISTPPGSFTLSPGVPRPYSTVNISVIREGYYPVENVGVPIFDGVLSEQNVNLIPSREGSMPEEGIVIDESREPFFQPGGEV